MSYRPILSPVTKGRVSVDDIEQFSRELLTRKKHHKSPTGLKKKKSAAFRKASSKHVRVRSAKK